jgi:hypothetical protein
MKDARLWRTAQVSRAEVLQYISRHHDGTLDTVDHFNATDLFAQFFMTRSCVHLVNDEFGNYDDDDLLTLVISPGKDLIPLTEVHHPAIHLLFAVLDLTVIILAHPVFGLSTFATHFMALCLGVACAVNLSWCIAGFLGKLLPFYRLVMRFAPYSMALGLMLCFHLWLAPMLRMTLQMWTPAAAQCPLAENHYRQISALTDRWYDFIFEHAGTCTMCTLPVNCASCADFCGPDLVSFVASNPSLRMIGDVASVHGFTFVCVILLVVFILPSVFETVISDSLPGLKRVPIYGQTIAAKWTNLMGRVTSPFTILLSPYRHDRVSWIIWRYVVRAILMFASGFQTPIVFIVISSIANGLYFLAILFSRPHISVFNYSFDLFTTFLSFIFPIIYHHLPPNPTYASAFPATALAIGGVAILGSLIYEFCLKRQSPYADKSNPQRRGVDGNDIDAGFCECCFMPGEREIGTDYVTINDIDFRDIEELETNLLNHNIGEEIHTNRSQLYRLTSNMMEAFSHVTMWKDLGPFTVIAMAVFGVILVGAGWYLGASPAIHWERVSVNC